jgi:hypothetical protein
MGGEPTYYEEVQRLTQALKNGAGIIVTTQPQALAEASSRAVMELREQLTNCQRTSERLHAENRALKEGRS